MQKAPQWTPAWFTGKRVTVMGLGLHGGGLAVARWMLTHGAEVCVTDLKTRTQLAPSVTALERAQRKQGSGSLRFALGGHRAADFRAADLVMQNPGVPRESSYLAIAQKAWVPIENEASIFFKIVRASCTTPSFSPSEAEGEKQKNPRVIAVTGTRGKSTTAALTHAMLRAAGRRAFLAGNNRIPMFDILDDVLRAARRGPVDVVLELSSWHCERLSRATGSADVAVIMNLLRDHLNRYGSMRSYAAAKARLVQWQHPAGIAICNAEDPVVRAIARVYARGRTRWFSGVRPHATPWVGTFVANGAWWYRDAAGDHRIAPRAALRILGEHNARNAAAAMTAARALGVSGAAMRRALDEFHGLPGRLEVVARRGGVTSINDTCATSPDGTIAALVSLRATVGSEAIPATNSERRDRRASLRSARDDRSIILIAGGTDKELAFDAWARVVAQSVKAVVFLPGTATTKMERALAQLGARAPPAHGAASMAAAVRAARRLARRGDTILLSPGCASFGLFQHEFDRGEQFNRAVKSVRQ